MVGTIVLLTGALAARVYGATIRASWTGAIGAVSGSAACAIAVWLAASAAGAWSPVWIPAIGGALGGLAIVALPWQRPLPLWAILDGSIFIAAAQYSVPSLGIDVTAIGSVFVAGIGLLLDVLVARIPARMRAGGALIASALGVLIVFAAPLPSSSLRNGLAQPSTLKLVTALAHIGIIPARDRDVERRELPTGAIAWLERPAGPGPFPAALFFHGAHSAGSFQPAAVAARRALRDAGFVVLAVDHPGFGESPSPRPDAGLAEWDPLPTAAAALDLLRKDHTVSSVIAVGHSMGTADVFRLLAAQHSVDAAVLFGATGLNESERTDYWYRRFHSDRQMPAKSLSVDSVLAIFELYYEPHSMVQNLRLFHPPIVYGRFARDWPHAAAIGEQLFAQIPGCKRMWSLAGSHYFASFGYHRLVAADMRVIRELALHLRQLAQNLKDPAVFDGETASTCPPVAAAR